MTRRRLTPKQRQDLYDRERARARAGGQGDLPICNLCGLIVLAGAQWDESHVGTPAAWNGSDTGIAHRRCNRLHGSKVVTPMVAKTKRVREKFLDLRRPTKPLPFGRDDRLKQRVGGGIVDRRTNRPPPRRPWVRQI